MPTVLELWRERKVKRGLPLLPYSSMAVNGVVWVGDGRDEHLPCEWCRDDPRDNLLHRVRLALSADGELAAGQAVPPRRSVLHDMWLGDAMGRFIFERRGG